MDVMKALLKASNNEYGSVAKDGTILDVLSYLDTSCYLLNGLVSGDIFKGIPNNKTISFSGQSKVGKTYLLIQMVRNFLDDNKNNFCIWWASEKGISKEMLAERKVDISRILILPVATVEKFNKEAWDELVRIQEIKKTNKDYNFMFVLDSLGQLNSSKEINDLEKDKQKEDMTRAKHVKKAFRNIELKTAFLNIPIIFTNHVYTKTGSFITSDELSGGYGVKFASDIIITITKAQYKVNDEIIGAILTCKNYKNRHAKENMKIKIELTYKYGISKYAGLFEFCKSHDLFKEVKKSDLNDLDDFEEFNEVIKDARKGKIYQFKFNDKLNFTEKEIMENPEKYFIKEVLNEINKIINEKFQYGNEYEEDVQKTKKQKVKSESSNNKTIKEEVQPKKDIDLNK